jgi:hypothetical protein
LTILSAVIGKPSVAAGPSDIATYVIENHGASDKGVLATFGAVFAPGAVSKGASLQAVSRDGTSIPLQVDAKATNMDGSMRHAVITVDIPHLASGADLPVTLRSVNEHVAPPPSVSLPALPDDFDTVVTLKTKGKVLSASAKLLLAQSDQKKLLWLSGPLVSEWWVSAPFRDEHGAADPHLSVQFGIRSYGRDKPLRIEADIENDWSYVPAPRTEFYDAQVRAGGKTVFSKSGMIQPSHTRWRFGFWWHEPVATYVRQNLNYLKKTHVIPNYDPSVTVSEDALHKLVEQFDTADEAPMAAGILEKYMPTTGGRPDIGPLPNWQAIYLLTMDPTAYRITLETADLGASFPVHYRNERTRRPITLEDYPNFSTHSNLVGKGAGQLPLPDAGGYDDPLVPDASHEPALDFVPYLITGDRFYLEELQFWSQWNLSGTDPVYRGFKQGLVKWDQVRGQAWSLRTLAQAEYITPDNDPMKDVLRRELKANVNWYENTYSKNSSANSLHFIPQTDALYDGGLAMAPWQDDYFTWSVGYVQSLGDADALQLLRWKAVFSVGRMIAPGFCWIMAPAYTLRIKQSPSSPIYGSFAEVYGASAAAQAKGTGGARGLECASSEMAHAFGLSQAGEMVNEATSPDGYAAYLQPALAASVDAGAPGAAKAWAVFQARPVKPNFETDPTWAIVPRM